MSLYSVWGWGEERWNTWWNAKSRFVCEHLSGALPRDRTTSELTAKWLSAKRLLRTRPAATGSECKSAHVPTATHWSNLSCDLSVRTESFGNTLPSSISVFRFQCLYVCTSVCLSVIESVCSRHAHITGPAQRSCRACTLDVVVPRKELKRIECPEWRLEIVFPPQHPKSKTQKKNNQRKNVIKK